MSQTHVLSSVLYGPKDLRLDSRSLEPPAPNELQISVRSTGICGSDQHYYQHYRNGDILVKEPLSLGHESAGIVEIVGADFENVFSPGDKVALEVGLPCEKCDLCLSGRYNICSAMRFRSSAKAHPHFQGNLQTRINHPTGWCHKIPENVTLEEGALLEPLGVALHGVARASLKSGTRALVIGAGAVGFLTAACLRVDKAKEITIADIEARRVEFATANDFADVGVTMPKKPVPDNLADRLKASQESATQLSGGQKDQDSLFDVVFECTGVESCVQSAIYATRPGGCVMLIGMGTPVLTLPMSAAALREVDIRGVFRYANTYRRGLEILANKEERGLPDVSKLVTHRYLGLEKVEDAFKMAGRAVEDDENLVLKVFIETK